MTCLFRTHRWSFPQDQGYRDNSGVWQKRGPAMQTCGDCGARRESPIRFGVEPEISVVKESLTTLTELKGQG